MARHRKRFTVGLIAAFVIGSLVVAGSTYFDRVSDAVDNVRVVENPEPPERWAITIASTVSPRYSAG